MDRLANIHPGEILLEEFLLPLEITAYRLSKDTDIPQTRISQIIKGKRRITADTALRFSSYFGNSAKFWLGLQDDYDIEEEKEDKEDLLIKIKKNAPTHNIKQLVFSVLQGLGSRTFHMCAEKQNIGKTIVLPRKNGLNML